MVHRRVGLVAVLLIAVATGGCTPSPAAATRRPAAATYEEYFVAACAAWDSLFRAVGNPDTGSGSDLSRALDAAVAAGDVAAAQLAAEGMARELKAAREQVAVARGWPPRTAMMVQLDRVLAAFEVGTAAKLAVAKGEPNAVDPQAAFEQAGGLEAWFAMIEAGRAAGLGAADGSNRQCANSITP
jgi:hypothetical protein